MTTTTEIALRGLRAKATARVYTFLAGDGHEVRETIDGIVSRARCDAAAAGTDPDEAEVGLRLAALVVEGDLLQPADAPPGSVAAEQLELVEWLMACAGLEWA